MPTLPANLGALRTQYGTFQPVGAVRRPGRGPQTNPRSKAVVFAGRVIAGFNVGDVPTYTLEDVITLVERLTPSDASFVLQRGLFTSRRTGVRVREDSAQVLLFSEGETQAAFTRDMLALARSLCREMQQEMVLLEIQKNGVQVAFYSVTP